MLDFTGKRILVIGDIMLDRYVYGRVERISPEAPVPVLAIERTVETLGGAANVAMNIKSLGGIPYLIGAVGNDEAGDTIKRLAIGADIPIFIIRDERQTTVKTRYACSQQILRCDKEEAKPCDLHDTITSVWHMADAMVISDYAKGIVTREMVAAVCQWNVPIIVDSKNPDWSIFKGATVITPNEKEYQAAHKEYSVPTILKTCGEQGMILMEEGREPVHIPAQVREVRDVTGAGDTVVATLALGLASGMSMLDAARLANKAAGIVVGKRGTATVTMEELCA